MQIHQTQSLQDPIQINYVSVDSLLLDDKNPRFAGLSKGAKESEILQKLQKEMHLDELIDSFEKNGFYNTEPLLVVKSTNQRGKYIVIEGNRRLAAIKTLLSTDRRLNDKLRTQLTKNIPIAVYPDRKSLWTYLGFRHINGPQEWDSYSKAVYALGVHRDYGIPIPKIADSIGDKHQTVVRMCNGLRVLEQAAKLKYFRSDQVELKRFYFSHLYTILGYENTRNFLGIEKRKSEIFSEDPVPKGKQSNLKELLEFLFGSLDGKKQSVIRSQSPDLKRLDSVLGNKTAINYLRDNSQEYGALEGALAYTGDEDYKLEDFVSKVLLNLRKVVGHMNRYKGDGDVLEQMEEVAQISSDVISWMKSKRSKK